MEEEERGAWSQLHDCLEQEDDDLLDTKINQDMIKNLLKRKVHLNELVPGTRTGVGGEVAPVGGQVLEEGTEEETDTDNITMKDADEETVQTDNVEDDKAEVKTGQAETSGDLLQ